MSLIGTLLLAFWLAPVQAPAQIDSIAAARSAIANTDYVRAINLLTASIAQQPSANGYLYLGIAYAHTRDLGRAEATLKQGAESYPADPRFHNELAGVYLAANDLDRARASLGHALSVDPGNKYANDLLATIDMSMGNVESALSLWNRDGHPVVGDILHNSHLTSESWVVDRATAFRPGEKLTYGHWRTTEARLWQSEIFSSVAIDVEPTPVPDRYAAVIRTVEKGNGRSDIFLSLLVGTLFFETPSLNWWNAAGSGISLDSKYRFSNNRHRAEAGLKGSIPLPGLLFLDVRGIWRSEYWDLSRVRLADTASGFRLKSTGFRAELKHIPHYKVEIGAGLEYRNRGGSDDRNTARMLFETSIIPMDGRYRNRIHAEAFVSRKSVLSDMNYWGGTAEINNRYVVSKDRAAYFDWTVKGGTARGLLPVEDYFVLGVDNDAGNLLRGHRAFSSDGRYGQAPMGTDFLLANTSFERRIRRLPLFNATNTPFIDLKWQVFADAARTFDRARLFKQGKLWVDIGAGLKFETPTGSINLTYGRSLRDGTGTLAAFYQRRW